MATVEGGMVCTDDYELYNTMLSIRSHGWLRDNDEEYKTRQLEKYNMHDAFNMQYFFVLPGLNIRNTDINAIIGISQLNSIDDNVSNRDRNYRQYCSLLDGNVWIQKSETSVVSSLAFGIVDKNKKLITSELIKNGVECRPLICGSIQEQPFWFERYAKRHLPNAEIIHKFGFYIPCHQDLTPEQIDFVSNIIIENSTGL